MFVPLNINLKNKKILIIGGGKVAHRKVKFFLQYDCDIAVVGINIAQEIYELYDKSDLRVELIQREFEINDLNEKYIVVIATDNSKFNEEIADKCEEIGLLYTNCSNGEESAFSVPAVVKRGNLSIAISTNGKSPALSKKIKKEVSEIYNDDYKVFLELLGELRRVVLKCESDDKVKKKLLNEAVNMNINELREFINNYRGEKL
ncbi:precorrin-2 dehydrogenase/sirohydrochlorin ferrochelatase family protein [Oceanirhabdus sp. W0125-5]|uniref:precorrin-2 dehydrogenase/sirohydrochlorin ferrochelatase family protein n=1 Tax=Oceanirhabdus sp. W0125-5 TaxID=2999116 RepID=UPI0022F2A852|nr:bifunctional precorrin-2 dehydrogenase/sirohydrochlorin ferrochelatase [Oceanirhabdus sp. W0125-5]WBW98453.1 bifunctional precorrin-2 dehydrogenase/sirohydrochlorin ferrochelatase [Oceanirhabdus sp. W0125-5]